MTTENLKGFDFSISSGQETRTTGHGGGGGSHVASTVVTVNAASALPPFPSVTVTRTSCGPSGALFKSHITDMPLPEMVPAVVEYLYCNVSPSGSVAFTTTFASGLSYNGKNGQTRIVVGVEINESIAGGRLRCRRVFCSEADGTARSGKRRANEITNVRFTML